MYFPNFRYAVAQEDHRRQVRQALVRDWGGSCAMGRIHPDAEDIHFSKHPEHREIVKPFLTAFDVTRAFWKLRDYIYARKDDPAARTQSEKKLLQFLKSRDSEVLVHRCDLLRTQPGDAEQVN
jgi:hypothetical protein